MSLHYLFGFASMFPNIACHTVGIDAFNRFMTSLR